MLTLRVASLFVSAHAAIGITTWTEPGVRQSLYAVTSTGCIQPVTICSVAAKISSGPIIDIYKREISKARIKNPASKLRLERQAHAIRET
jgi:hypothetical protein